MKRTLFSISTAILFLLGFFLLPHVTVSASEIPADKPIPDGFVSLFDGKTLDGWDGDPTYWSVQDGCVTGISTPETPIKYNTFLVWKKGEVDDFELLVDFRLFNHNSGIQYRAFMNPGKPWSMGGYQADIAGKPHMGIVYGEGYRGILAQRGQQTTIGQNGRPVVTGSVGDSEEILSHIDLNGWNTYRIVAKGNVCSQYINGVKVSEVIDEDDIARASGLLGFQMHVGPAMKVQFKNIFLKK
ncbi:MAG: DUF1080 domain-containing protein [Thermoguttaceae bacterium]|nr:DUF1080 domain-containing protein [Thermoguttaceae bacterium]